MTEAEHMHRCLLRWICQASPDDRAKFVEVSRRVRGAEETDALIAQARAFWAEMKKRGEL